MSSFLGTDFTDFTDFHYMMYTYRPIIWMTRKYLVCEKTVSSRPAEGYGNTQKASV